MTKSTHAPSTESTSTGSTSTGDSVVGVTGQHTTNGVPHGYSAITPFIVVNEAARALEFYLEVFGARIVDVTRAGDVIAHAVLDFHGQGVLQLGDAMPDYHLVAPPGGGDACYSLGLYCDNADAVVARAEAAGATIREPLTTFVSGDRFASILDPFGVRWSVMCRVEDLSAEESNERVRQWAADNFGS